eukprot:GDKH01014505.1.p1 GENE.GDKH01014505.1~~GDKH01014505.1.p1  ORF type:complete len:203 (+),score=22.23 GDKH01014505.1:2-610(+)
MDTISHAVEHVRASLRGMASRMNTFSNEECKAFEKVHETGRLAHQHSLKQEEPRVVLVPVDGSPTSQHAVEWFVNHGLRPADKLVLLSVWKHSEPMEPQGTVSPITASRHNTEQIETAQDNVLSSKKLLQRAENPIHLLTLPTDTAQRSHIGGAICHAAQELNADLCVLGSRGIGGGERFMLGSTSKYVLDHVTCPVLVVKD